VRVGGAAGGVAGAGGQVVADAAAGDGFVPANVAATGIAGVLGGMSAPFVGAPRAAGFAGAAAPSLSALARQESPAPADVAIGAATGPILSSVGGSAAGRKLRKLTSFEKGRLGEQLSMASSNLRGDRIREVQTRIPTNSGGLKRGYTVADHVTDKHVVEAKFGRTRLSEAQKRALANPDLRYLPEHWLTRDIHDFAGMIAWGLGGPALRRLSHTALQGLQQPAEHRPPEAP